MGMIAEATVGAFGAFQQAGAQAGAAKYNAAVERGNAFVSKQNAAMAGQAGAEQSFMQGLKTRSELGTISAHQGASNVDVNSGSNVDTRLSAGSLGELDALTTRANAVRTAYGYEQQAQSHEAEARLDKFEATNDLTAGYVNAGSTVLGAADNAAEKFAKFQLAGGFGG